MARYAVCRCEVIVKCQHCVSQPSLLLISLSFAMAQVAVDQMLRSVLCDAPSIHEKHQLVSCFLHQPLHSILLLKLLSPHR